MRKKDRRLFDDEADGLKENSYGGFQYRWNYDEYQKSLQKKRRKAAGHGMRAFFITTAFVFFMCFASLIVVLTAAFLHGTSPENRAKTPGPSSDVRLPAEEAPQTDKSIARTDPGQTGTEGTGNAENIPDVGKDDPAVPQNGNGGSGTGNAGNTKNGQAGDPDPDETVSAVPVSTEETAADISERIVPQDNTVKYIADTCLPSTVSISCKNEKKQAVGSGFFLSADGYLLTNFHVIRDFETYQVVLHDGTEYEAALVGSDVSMDLAVLHIDAEDLLPVVIGDSDSVGIGDSVVAIGTPASTDFAGTVTGGYISGLNRKVEVKDSDKNIIGVFDMLQTTAVINPGNSGGPLFNAKGEVIGINALKITENGYEGMGFSIPISGVIGYAQSWISADRELHKPAETDTEPVTDEVTEGPDISEILPAVEEPERAPAVLGITVETVTEQDAVLYRIPSGVLIVFAEEHSNAAEGGLMTDDIILSVDGTQMLTAEDFAAWEAEAKDGDLVEITVFRDGGELTLHIQLKAAPETAELQPVDPVDTDGTDTAVTPAGDIPAVMPEQDREAA